MRVRVKLAGAATYHVTSRIVEQLHLMDDAERERFRGIMRSAEAFSGVKILTYALLANHFHILLQVPEQQEVTEEEVIGRCRLLYGDALTEQMVQQWQIWRAEGQSALAQSKIDALRARMYDVSQFMQTLKMRYTRAYNASHGRVDPLWVGRFKSVLVDEQSPVLQVLKAYIDHNPVRAGIVADPKDYAWSGSGEASLGQAEHGSDAPSAPRAGLSREQVEEVLKKGGKLGLDDTLCCHVRSFHDGFAIGSREFVEHIFRTFHKTHFGQTRKTGARPIRGIDWAGEKVFSARDLKLNAIRPPD